MLGQVTAQQEGSVAASAVCETWWRSSRARVAWQVHAHGRPGQRLGPERPAVGVCDADLNGPTMAKIMGVRGHRLALQGDAVQPPVAVLGVKADVHGSVGLDATPAGVAGAHSQSEAHTWRGSMEAQAVREFLADTGVG